MNYFSKVYFSTQTLMLPSVGRALAILIIPLTSSSLTQVDSETRVLFYSHWSPSEASIWSAMSVDITPHPVIASWMIYCFLHALGQKLLHSLIQLKCRVIFTGVNFEASLWHFSDPTMALHRSTLSCIDTMEQPALPTCSLPKRPLFLTVPLGLNFPTLCSK